MAVSMRTTKREASDQWASRSTRSNRRTRPSLAGSRIATAVGGSNPGVDVVAVLLPEAGVDAIDHTYGRQPLERLVAVHRCHVEANGPAVLARHRAAEHAVGHDDIRAGGL